MYTKMLMADSYASDLTAFGIMSVLDARHALLDPLTTAETDWDMQKNDIRVRYFESGREITDEADLTAFGIMSPTMNLTLLTTVILAVIMYFVNLHMMTKKLNLE